jgi:hypothetical protein
MLNTLRGWALRVGTGEVLVAAVRDVAIMLVFIVLLGQLAKVAL